MSSTTSRPSLATAREAQALLGRHLPVSRLLAAPALSATVGSDVYLKLETELPTGSFKPRGALYALAINLERGAVREVVASSTGNHGAGVAWAASLLCLPATIFLPAGANPVKRARIAALGATIIEAGADSAAAFELARARSRADGVYFLNDATDPDLPAGPATIALEILDQLPSLDTIVVPMGDTALIRGVAAVTRHLCPAARIVGVQAERAPSYYLSWKEGRPVPTDRCDTIADGLATRTPDPGNVRAIRDLVDDVVLVSDAEMLAAIRHLAVADHVIAEPAGAAATAALLHGRIRCGRHTVVLVTGANVTPDVLTAALCGSSQEIL